MARPTSRLLAGACLLAIALAACTGGQPARTPAARDGSSGSPGTAPSPPASGATPSTTSTATPTPSLPAARATAVPNPSEPPVARVIAGGGEPATGALGSYTWQGAGSDSPWIIVPARDAVRLPPPYRVELDPALVPVAWTAAWAPIEQGLAGPIAGYAQGTGSPAQFDGPRGAGPWTLRLEADFGRTGRAAWYWRLDPEP